MKSPAEQWAATSGKELWVAQLARAYAKAAADLQASRGRDFYFWLGAESDHGQVG